MSDSEWTYIKDKEDWDHYCARIDNSGAPFFNPDRRYAPYGYYHSPEPVTYPCLCQSSMYDDPNGPYSYDHSYVYLEDAAMLLNASLTDLMSDLAKHRQVAIDFLVLLGEVDAKRAAEIVDKRVRDGR